MDDAANKDKDKDKDKDKPPRRSEAAANATRGTNERNEGNFQDRLERTHRDYQRRLQEIQIDTQRRLEDAYYDYLKVCREAWTVPNSQRLVADASRVYMDAQRAVSDEHTKRTEDAFDEHMRRLEGLWGEVNFRDLDPQSMVAIGGSLLWAAQCSTAKPAEAEETQRPT